MRTVKNNVHLEGWLYEHDLTQKVTGDTSKNPGTPFISGTISIATDDQQLNIVNVHFTYVTATTSSGKANATFDTLSKIVSGELKTIMSDGVDSAAKLRVDTSIGLNEFYSERNGQEELVSVMRNEGGFVHVVNAIDPDEAKRNTFETDIVITRVTRVEGDPDKGTTDKVNIRGVIFDFRKNILPITFTTHNDRAMAYFENLGASDRAPVFTKVYGRQTSTVVVRRVTEESAFGEPIVKEYPNSIKEFVVTNALRDTYIWDSEEDITAEELRHAMQQRETDLAAMKRRQDEYKASRGNASSTTKNRIVSDTTPSGDFEF